MRARLPSSLAQPSIDPAIVPNCRSKVLLFPKGLPYYVRDSIDMDLDRTRTSKEPLQANAAKLVSHARKALLNGLVLQSVSRFCRFFCVSGMGHIWPEKQNGRHHLNGGRQNGELEVANVNGFVQHANGHRRRIGFLGFDGVRTLDLAGPLEAFTATTNLHTQISHDSTYQVILIGLKRKTFVSESGIIFRAQETTDTAGPLDTIVIPGGAGLNLPTTLSELSALLSQHGRTARRVAAVCGGIYPLAQSGLLDGRSVTTHWRFAHDVAKRFPALHVNTNVSFIKDGSFYTCGGGAAGIEMTLSLINEDQGPETALALARELVVRLRPPGEGDTDPDPSIYQSGPSEKIAKLPA